MKVTVRYWCGNHSEKTGYEQDKEYDVTTEDIERLREQGFAVMFTQQGLMFIDNGRFQVR